MQERTFDVEDGTAGLDRENLLETIATLRRDVSSMANEVREVLRENERYEQELSALRQRAKRPSSAERVRDEIDSLMSMYERVSPRRARTARATRREEGGDGRALKKMMMMMLLSEML